MTSLKTGIFKNLLEAKVFLLAAAVLFIGGAFIGYGSSIFEAYEEQQAEQIRKLAESIRESGNAQLKFFLIIFVNNAVKAVLVFFAGLLFGILPVLFLFINGLVIGYVFQKAAEQGTDTVSLFLKGILPHGILEIPTIIVASGLGMRLGFIVVRSIYRRFSGAKRAESGAREHMKRSMPILVLLVCVLLVAAVIESTVTFWLLKQ